MKPSCIRWLVVLALLPLAGCQALEPMGLGTFPMNTVVLGPSLIGRVEVEATNANRTPSGTVEVWATLRNLTAKPIHYQGRALFYDNARNQLESPTAWHRGRIPANSQATFREYSTLWALAGYVIEIHEVAP